MLFSERVSGSARAIQFHDRDIDFAGRSGLVPHRVPVL